MLLKSDLTGFMMYIEELIGKLSLQEEQKDIYHKEIREKIKAAFLASATGSCPGGDTPGEEDCNNSAVGVCSHAEGCSTTATGDCSHSEGNQTTAEGMASHAEGCITDAIGICSHAEGIFTTTSGSYGPHAEGIATEASGNFGSHAEGIATLAGGQICSHAEGIVTTARGEGSHAEGINTEASRNSSHAEGNTTVASGDTAHAEGDGTTASGFASHAEGNQTSASADNSHAEGRSTTANEIASHAEGTNTTASGVGAHAEGAYTEAGIDATHAEGYTTRAFGIGAHAEGMETFANQFASHAEGANTLVNAFASHAEGYYTNTEQEGAHIMGRYGDACEPYAWHMAGGNNEDERAVTAIIRNDGTACFQAVNTCPTCPDYAEMFETIDGSPIDVGYFVTLDGEKIRKASVNDEYILGVTSATPAILGGTAALGWKDHYLTDEWGRFLYQEVLIPARKDKEGREICPERTVRQKMVNPAYDQTQNYTPRTERAEWVPVCLLGQVLVRDDGTCQVNGYCRPDKEGIATAGNSGYRVIKRTGEKQILIIFK